MDYDSLYTKTIIGLSRLNKARFGRVLSVILGALIRFFYPCDISVFAKLGKIYIPHAVGIVVGHSAIIEDGVTIMSGVVIGGRYGHNYNGRRGHAHIKQNVMLGANAVILGTVTVGEGAVIGANAVITKDVPENAVVVGNNKILYIKSDSDGFNK